MNRRISVVVALALALCGCAALPRPVTVLAAAETSTAVTAGRSEAPGNPAMWVGGNRREPEGLIRAGFLAVTRPTGGLAIHSLDGVLVHTVDGPRLADIDVSGLALSESYAVVVGGTRDTGRGTRVALYRLDRDEGQIVRLWGEIETDLSSPRGFCMRQTLGVLRAAVIDRRGEVRHLEIAEGPDGAPVAIETQRYRLADAGEGCAIDPPSGAIYFSHRENGFWRSSIVPPAAGVPVRLADPSPRRLPRSRGVAYLTSERSRFLVSLDEDHAAFSVWRIEGAALAWAGRFEVRETPAGRPVRSFGSLDAYGGPIGGWPSGVVVVQDRADAGSPNLKLIDWADVRRALGL